MEMGSYPAVIRHHAGRGHSRHHQQAPATTSSPNWPTRSHCH